MSEKNSFEAYSEKYEKLGKINFSDLADSINDGIIIIDLEGDIIYANNTIINKLGYSSKEFLELDPGKFFDQKNQDIFEEQIKNRRNKITEQYELEWLKKDGGRVCTIVSSQFLYDDDQNLIGSYEIIKNISDLKTYENKLKETNKNLSDIQNLVKLGSWEWNIKTGSHQWSQETYKIYEMSPKSEPSLESISELIHPDDIPLFNEAMELLMENEQPEELNYRLKFPDGKIKYVVGIAKVEMDDDGQPHIAFGTIQDVTEKKQIEIKTQESQELLRSILKNSPDVIMMVDLKGNIQFVSAHDPKISDNDTVGQNIYSFVPENEQPKIKNTIKLVSEDKITRSYESAVFAIDGSIRYFSTRVGPVEHNGNIDSVILISTDITEKKEAEQKIIKSEARLRSIMDISSNWIWESDLEGRITFSNDSVKDYIGYSTDRIVGRKVSEFLLQKDSELIFAKIPYYIQSKKGWRNLTFRWRHRDGEIKYLKSSSTPIFENGAVVGFRGVDEDITEYIQAQQKIKDSEAQWRSLVQNAPNLILSTDWKGQILFANQEFKSIKAEQLIGQSIFELFDDIDKVKIKQTIEDIFISGQSTKFETKIAGEKGIFRWYVIRVNPVMIDNMVKTAVFIATDITNIKTSSNSVIEKERRSRAIVDTAPEAIMLYDLEKEKFIDANQRSIDLFEYSLEELLNLGPMDISPQYQEGNIRSEDFIREQLAKLFKGTIPIFEFIYLSKSGKSIKCEISLTILDENGRKLVRASAVDLKTRK